MQNSFLQDLPSFSTQWVPPVNEAHVSIEYVKQRISTRIESIFRTIITSSESSFSALSQREALLQKKIEKGDKASEIDLVKVLLAKIHIMKRTWYSSEVVSRETRKMQLCLKRAALKEIPEALFLQGLSWTIWKAEPSPLSFAWIDKAASAWLTDAKILVAWYYYCGIDTQENPQFAYSLLLEEAKKGNIIAQRDLAFLFPCVRSF